MNWNTPKTLAKGFLVFSMIFVLGGCLKQDGVTGPETGNSDAPTLPEVSTMKFQMGFLGELPEVDEASILTGKASGEMAMTAGERSNWINGVIRVLFLQLSLFDALEEPVGAFAYAIHSIPQAQEDGSYLWTYIFAEGQMEYSVFLFGTPMADRVAWRMEVSSNDPEMILDHFVWFDGESMNDDRSGYWQFYAPVDEATVAKATVGKQVIRINWAHEGNEDSLRLEINELGGEAEGDYIEFRETSEQGSIDYFDSSEGQMANITALADGSGSITVPDYNDGLKACWDTEQFNADCN